VLLGIFNETDFGRRGIQYVHYPTYLRPRPKVDLRWYHGGATTLNLYYAFADRVADFSLDRLKANVTLVNSDWTGRKFRETYGGATRTIHPPAAGTFPDVPWENRLDRFVVLGRISPEKEIEKLVKIVEGVRALGHPVRLLLVGILEKRGAGRRYGSRILALARDRRAWMEVRLGVDRAELETLVASSRWGLHGMEEEHYGMAVAEMVLAGCVPFVPNGGGPVEIVGDVAELRYASVQDAVAKIDAVRRDPQRLGRVRGALDAQKAHLGADRFMREMRDAIASM